MILRVGLTALLTLLISGCAADTPALHRLDVGGSTFHVELARDPGHRARGLMGRTHLAPDGGMLFVFESPDRHCFWMRDTPLALSIAFIDTAGVIVSLADMAPASLTRHCPPAPIRYALEVASGRFRAQGIGPGDVVTPLPP